MSTMLVNASMHPGMLRHRVDIVADASTPDAAGSIKAWTSTTTVATAWAFVQAINLGREEFGSPQWTVSKTPYAVWIRRRTDITEKMRIVFGSRVFRIAAIPVSDGLQEYVRLVCEEVKQ